MTEPPVVFDRPTLDLAAAATLAGSLFGVTGSVAELPSERDRNFVVGDAEGPRIVLKVSGIGERRETLELQHQALDRLAARQPSLGVPRVRRLSDGGTIGAVDLADGRHLVTALDWLPGSNLAGSRPRTALQLSSLGELLGQLATALDGWDPPAARRALKWDLGRASWILDHLDAVAATEDRALVARMFGLYRALVLPSWDRLPHAVIHNDANDHNVLVAGVGDASRCVGLIDFGDMLWSASIAEPAIAAAYGMLDAADPLAAAALVFGGFHRRRPLDEIELSIGFPLIVARLCVSVVNSAIQRQAKPENGYLTVSEEPAWETLRRLAEIHPRLAEARLREACGSAPSSAGARLTRWLATGLPAVTPVVDTGEIGPAPIDLSVGSLSIPRLTTLSDEAELTQIINAHLVRHGARLGVGGYDEARLVYQADQYRSQSLEGPEWRTIHLGLDVFGPVGTVVRAPLDGRVHGVRLNDLPGDYGPTVILEHRARDEQGEFPFWTLYGHLDGEVLDTLRAGQSVPAGAVIGRFGPPAVNGGWTPHLHFQVIADLLGRDGEFPGVAAPSVRRVWTSLSPDPHRVAGLPDLRRASAGADELRQRRSILGANLSLSYREPLHIVRGWMQHLYDAEGRRYLDAVNNVPHVGHCHPDVVRAATEQMAVLNTNTRYLHETVIRYGERLTATLPKPLRVCFLVNSGSEANELALRLAWTHTGRRGTIVLEGAYHGNTDTLVSISPYKCLGPGGRGLASFARALPMPDCYRGRHREGEADSAERYAGYTDQAIESLAAAEHGVAAFLSESLLSCGGQIVLPAGYLAAVYRRIRAAGGVCIADEVQVGFGRVGTHFWGFETQEVVPDIVVMGKPAGNGHPLGIVVTTPEIAASFDNGMEFFSTFGGNPVSAAVGLAVLETIEREALQARALATGDRLLDRLAELGRRHEAIGQVRGRGLFLGVELVADRERRVPAADIAAYLANRMRAHRILVSTDGPDHNVIKIKPPMVFDPADADLLVDAMAEILEEDAVRCRSGTQ